MLDLEYLTKLVSLLKTQGVTCIKMVGLELSLSRTELPATSASGPPTPHEPDQAGLDKLIDVDESQLPVDLRSDQVTDYDKILNWSAPDAQGEPLPGTGDVPIE